MATRATSRQLALFDDDVRPLVDEIGDWASGPGPLYRQLARAVGGAVERGALARDTRLPSERVIAAALVVSRGTAVAAYDLLVSEGFVERRRGSGTFVLGAGVLALPPGREGSALVHRLVDRSTGASSVIDLSLSVLHDVDGLPPASVAVADLQRVVPDTGYSPWGLPSLRAAVAAHVSGWGLATTDAEVVITTGAQQAISAAAVCWVRPGDVVAIDDPTYPGAIAAFLQAGARLVPVATDDAGVRLSSLRAVLKQRPAIVYLQSTLSSPTGRVLPERRRREIAQVVRESRVPLVEDLALADLAWSTAPPPIASFCPDASVAVVGSLSKPFWGGLRVGFVRAPEPVALRFARVKATHDLGSSAVSQLLAERLLRALPSTRFLDRRRTELRARYEVLAGGLRRELPEWTWKEPDGGLSLWARLPTADAEPFAQAALRAGVAVATAGALSVSGDYRNWVRLSFSDVPDVLEEGVRRLAAAWRS